MTNSPVDQKIWTLKSPLGVYGIEKGNRYLNKEIPIAYTSLGNKSEQLSQLEHKNKTKLVPGN